MSLRGRWRAVSLRLFGAAVSTQETPDPFLLSGEPPEPGADSFSDLLGEIEASALAVYRAHGLPTRQGHYKRSSQGAAWAFIAETLTPAERFEQAASAPADEGWRFGRLSDLGRRSDTPALVAASEMLEGAALARRLRSDGTPPEDLVRMIRLGESWRLARELSVVRTSRLSFAEPAKSRRKKRQA